MYPFFILFGYELPAYWLMGMLGGALALAILWRSAPKHNLPRNDAMFIAVHAIAGALVGSKLLYIITLAPLLIEHRSELTLELFGQILMGGGVFYGGLLGGVLGALWYCRRYKVSIHDALVVAVPVIPLFHAFGRLGCFFAGCCWGVEWEHGFVYHLSLAAPNDVPLFPVQLVEAALNLALFAALTVYRNRASVPWRVAPLYCVVYGLGRFALEFLRGDTIRGVLLLSTSQWISLALVAAGLFVLIRSKRRK